MPPQFPEVIQANVSRLACPRLASRCSSQCDRNHALSPISQTSLAIAVFGCKKSPLTSRHHRLQVFNLTFHCPHSLCNAVGGQHPSRKPRRDAGRLSTSPDTKSWTNTLRAYRLITKVLPHDFFQSGAKTYQQSECMEAFRETVGRLWVDCMIKSTLLALQLLHAQRDSDFLLQQVSLDVMMP